MEISKFSKISPLLLLLPLAGGCTDPNRVMFVTSTTIGGTLEAKEGAGKIAFDRTEGVIGPALEDGQMPSVYGYLATDGGIISRNTKQVYATGRAAEHLSVPSCTGDGCNGSQSKPPTTLPPDVLRAMQAATDAADAATAAVKALQKTTAVSGTGTVDPKRTCIGIQQGDVCRSVGFFGTSTIFGLKLSAPTQAALQDYVLGYRRKEFSILPLTQRGGGNSIYPSTIASLTSAGFIDPSVAPGQSAADAAAKVVEADASKAQTQTPAAGKTTSEKDGDAKKRAGLSNVQFFASGVAADNLSQDAEFQKLFKKDVNSAVVADYRATQAAQDAHVNAILGCYGQITSPARRQEAWLSGVSNKVLGDVNAFKLASNLSVAAQKDVPDSQRAAALTMAGAIYVSGIQTSHGLDKERSLSLSDHENEVCQFAKAELASATQATATPAPSN